MEKNEDQNFGKCNSCGYMFKTELERISHKCPNIISTDKMGVKI